MEESLREALPADAWRETFAQTIDEQRRRVAERIASQRERLHELDARIAAQLDETVQALTREQEQARQAAGHAEAKVHGLDERQSLLQQRQQQLDEKQAELEKLQVDLAGKLAAEVERQKELKRREAELTAARQTHDDDVQNLKSQLDAAKQLEGNFKLKEQALTEREQLTKRQRKTAAQQLRARKNELTAEAELVRTQAAANGAGQDLQLQLRLSELQGKYEHLRAEFDSREVQRDETTRRLAELKAQLESRQHEIGQQQAALTQSQKKQAELEAERTRLQADMQRHFEESRRQAETARDELARHTSEARSQAAEIARLAGELERVGRESREQLERLRAEQGKSHDAQVQSLQQQLDELRKQLADREVAWDGSRRDFEQQLAVARKSGGGGPAAAAELATLRDENKQLEAWLAEAEEKAKHASPSGGQDMDDLRRRFEMAVQDVRELKTKNAELSEQLAKRSSTLANSASATAGGDWESLKQKLLADLETDFDEGDGGQKADKLTVQGAIKITDEVVAQKEHEIEELRRLLDSQTQQVGEVAVGAAAVAQMLDTDELIRQERDSLKRLQDNLREQLRQAEVDISVERAKLARERAELDEKIRGIEADKANRPVAGTDSGGDKGKKPGGRKWLARLGLGDGKDE